MSSRLQHACEYQAARLGLALIEHCDPATACRVAGALAELGFRLLGKRRRIALANLRQSGVAVSPAEARRLARASFRHLACVIVESFHAPKRLNSDAWQESLTLEMPPATRALLETPGRGLIMVSGHLGNWEIGAQVLARFKPLTGVARAMNNPRVQALLESRQMRGDFVTVDKHTANPMQLVRALRRGRILALLTDQHARDNSVPIDFFGRPARTYTTPAVLHLLTEAPILFGYSVREGVLRYRFILSEPLVYPTSGDRDADVLRITRDLAKRLEDAIREHPGQYLWMHRRWKP
ncbi:MAG: hypothetical protein PHR35_05995 [Kiritimatiellae bacterium]|nr:hypothetical protein [Kiritimatiellia bacterium]